MAIATLTVDLVARLGKMEQELNRATHLSEKAANRINEAFAVTKGTIGTMLAGVTVGGAWQAFISDTAKLGAEISRLSQVSNASVEDFQLMAYGAKSAGVEQSQLADILKDVNDKFGEFSITGGGELKDFFDTVAKKAGVTAEAFKNLSGPQALQRGWLIRCAGPGPTSIQPDRRQPAMAQNVLAVYPGTFDPITLGHEDVVRRATQLFGQVIVAVAAGHHKKTLFSLEERIEMVREATRQYPQVQVESFSGLLRDFVVARGGKAMVRGLRAVTDFDYEFQLAGMNRSLMPEVETVFLTPSDKYQFISSTFVREIAVLGGEVDKFVSPAVQQRLAAKVQGMAAG